MRFGKDLIGKSIVSMDEGRIIGTVRDIYLDSDLERLIGLHLGREGLLSRKSKLIPRSAIAVMGVDVILTKMSDVVTDDKTHEESAEWILLDKLQGREVDTSGRTKVGHIGDVILNEDAYVVGFTLSRVYVEGPIAENRTIMRDAILDNGNVDGSMTVDLAKVEKHSKEN